MPIYLVRWPGLSASLVRARSEGDLLYILDQVANPDGCEWSVYEGPLFIDFRLPVEWSISGEPTAQPVAPEQVVIGDVGPMAEAYVVEAMDVSLAQGDDGLDTGEEILRRAFPEIHAAVEKYRDSEEAEEREWALPEADLRKALHGELVRFLRSSWRRAQLLKKDDPVSRLAAEMDLPLALAQKHADIVSEHQARKEKPDPSPEPSPHPPEEERPAAGGPLFKVANHHTESCGRPPTVDGDAPGAYHGYFANEHGEQAIYTYDPETGEATVRMGDAGWATVHRVVGGRLAGVNTTEAEATWIRACWLVTGALHQG